MEIFKVNIHIELCNSRFYTIQDGAMGNLSKENGLKH